MTDKKLLTKNLTVDSFKELVLEMERENLVNISKEDKKVMVSKIIRIYEEAKNHGNQ
ncbi:MAG: hypothetical protein LBR68_03340 [Lachnoclostridium sp.]|jgi:hypothetical protein|nr:hypothetical protein [Lachnoclostridium sp.]